MAYVSNLPLQYTKDGLSEAGFVDSAFGPVRDQCFLSPLGPTVRKSLSHPASLTPYLFLNDQIGFQLYIVLSFQGEIKYMFLNSNLLLLYQYLYVMDFERANFA